MGANADIQKNYLESAIKDLSSAKYLLTQFEIPPHLALHAAKLASSLGMTSIVNPAPAVDDPNLNYEGVSILIPNEIEAKILAGVPLDQEIDHGHLLTKIHQKLHVDTIIITLGENGVFVQSEGEIWSQKPPRTDVVDASGAGDQFCAALAVALNNEMDLKDACQWAMHAASISVTRKGTIPAFVRKEEGK
jgi:ribokinase